MKETKGDMILNSEIKMKKEKKKIKNQILNLKAKKQ